MLAALLEMLIAHLPSQELLAKAAEVLRTIAQEAAADGTEEAKELSVEAEAGLPTRTRRIQPRSRILKVLVPAMAK